VLGAIAGDIVGSVYEGRRSRITHPDFPLFQPASRFTDDTVLTVAVANAILTAGDYAESIRAFARRYPHAGYGGAFRQWMQLDDAPPYGSWGNGSAMRVSAVGWAFDTAGVVVEHARRSAAVTHDHPEGIKGAQAVALAVYRARTGADKDAIRTELTERFGYDLDRTIEEIRPRYRFDVSCQGSVSESLIAFFESTDVEHAIRLAISLGGDSDTMACIAGAVAEAYYGGVPVAIVNEIHRRLPRNLWAVVEAFGDAYGRR
jgi:ADP-ribosylglycohydrolase